MVFHPPLAATTYLPLSNPSSPTSSILHFSYLPPPSFPSNATPEIWTNLAAGDGAWHALPFSFSAASGLWTAEVDLSRLSAPQDFEYTYRLRHASGEVDWLGSSGANGRVEVVASHPPGASTAVPPLIAREDGQGTWEELGENVAVGRFRLEEGKSGETSEFDVTELVQSAGEGGGGWADGEGVVWEQSSRTWFVPRVLSASKPLESLSSQYPAQLLILRSAPCAAHPIQRTLVVFPFSTAEVCSTLSGGSGGKFLLRCERDSAKEGVEGHLAVAWGVAGQLQQLVAACVAVSRSVLVGKSYEPPAPVELREASSTSPSGTAPLPLGVCTWNALGPQYTLSDVLAWLDSLVLSSSTSHSPTPALSPLSSTGALKTLLLDDGWQDTATFVDFEDTQLEEHAEHSQRRALRSFGVRKGFYDIGGTTAPPSKVASRAETPTGSRTPQGQSRARSDSGYGKSPDLSLASMDPRDIEMAREGVCAELCDALKRIKERGIERVGVWMTLLGYWHGVHPDGALADIYELRRTHFRSTAHPSFDYKLFLPSPADLPQFFTDYFTSLRSVGVDFVKVDDQASLDAIVRQEAPEGQEEADPGEFKHLLLSSMRNAAEAVFGSSSTDESTSISVVHCMAGSPRIWGGSLGLVGASPSDARALVRNSDDFFPLEPDSHRWHLAQNALGAVLSRQLRFTPDFDMAQAKHPFGQAHLALRAFSSAPVYVTDGIREGEAQEEKQEGREGSWTSLLAATKGGPRVLQAPEGSGAGTVLEGRLTDDVLNRYGSSSNEALKVGLALPQAKGAHLGLWNVLAAPQVAHSLLDTKDLGDALGSQAATVGEQDGTFVLFSPSSSPDQPPFVQETSASELDAARVLPRALAQPVKAYDLPQAGVEVVSLTQVFSLPASGEGSDVSIACLGLLDKTVGLAAIKGIKVVASGEQEKARAIPALDSPRAAPLPSAEAPSSAGTSSQLATVPSSTSSTASARPRPVPTARLPFLLAYLTGFLRPALLSAHAQQNGQQQRTPAVELRSLLRDLFRSPFRTLFSEVRAVLTFGLAAVMWAVGGGSRSGSNGGRTLQAARVQPQQAEPAEDVASPRPTTLAEPVDPASPPKTRLHLQLSHLSPSLGFYIANAGLPSSFPSSRLHITLDGRPVPAAYISQSQASENIVEVNAEGAWKSLVGRAEKGRDAEGWELTVEVVA
ncbi:hypothetical protein JCM10213_003046 [Rhodosporidiobolus nylandii]